MSELSTQSDMLRSWADQLSEHEGDLGVVARALVANLREAADTIGRLGQKIEDLEGMLGELPPEGKCAMLLVKQVDGEYVWNCERYDFASYCLVDSEADTYTGMTLNDPFDRADFADKLTMAKELRKMAASLDAQGDILGILTDSDAFGQKLSESRYSELFGTPERAARTFMGICDKVPDCGVCQISETIEERCNYDALLEWLKGEGKTDGACNERNS